jgi:hypothetical protein
MAPWWWFLREPKHVGVTVGIFNCFNIPVILWFLHHCGTIKVLWYCWCTVQTGRFVHCIYQHRLSRDWSEFLSPDGVTVNGMPHRRMCVICFVHIITGTMLTTLGSVAVRHNYLWRLCQSDVHHRKLRLAAHWSQLYVHGKITFVVLRFVKEWNKSMNESRAMFLRKIVLLERQIEYWSWSVHFFCCCTTTIASWRTQN